MLQFTKESTIDKLSSSALNFGGLSVQPPKPGLSTMAADGFRYPPDQQGTNLKRCRSQAAIHGLQAAGYRAE
jgi:hypothetical protein